MREPISISKQQQTLLTSFYTINPKPSRQEVKLLIELHNTLNPEDVKKEYGLILLKESKRSSTERKLIEFLNNDYYQIK